MNATKYQLITLKDHNDRQLVDGVVMLPLTVNTDPRGSLTEGLKTTWKQVYHHDNRPFTQMYFSTTAPGVARDLGHWHYHPGGQEDRFGIVNGDIAVVIYDNRDKSPTKGILNIFLMGESQGTNGQYLLLIPKQTYHGYLVTSQDKATMFNFPTSLYDPSQEVRLSFNDNKLADGTVFSWAKVKELLKI